MVARQGKLTRGKMTRNYKHDVILKHQPSSGQTSVSSKKMILKCKQDSFSASSLPSVHKPSRNHDQPVTNVNTYYHSARLPMDHKRVTRKSNSAPTPCQTHFKHKTSKRPKQAHPTSLTSPTNNLNDKVTSPTSLRITNREVTSAPRPHFNHKPNKNPTAKSPTSASLTISPHSLSPINKSSDGSQKAPPASNSPPQHPPPPCSPVLKPPYERKLTEVYVGGRKGRKLLVDKDESELLPMFVVRSKTDDDIESKEAIGLRLLMSDTI